MSSHAASVLKVSDKPRDSSKAFGSRTGNTKPSELSLTADAQNVQSSCVASVSKSSDKPHDSSSATLVSKPHDKPYDSSDASMTSTASNDTTTVAVASTNSTNTAALSSLDGRTPEMCIERPLVEERVAGNIDTTARKKTKAKATKKKKGFVRAAI